MLKYTPLGMIWKMNLKLGLNLGVRRIEIELREMKC